MAGDFRESSNIEIERKGPPPSAGPFLLKNDRHAVPEPKSFRMNQSQNRPSEMNELQIFAYKGRWKSFQMNQLQMTFFRMNEFRNTHFRMNEFHDYGGGEVCLSKPKVTMGVAPCTHRLHPAKIAGVSPASVGL